MTQLLTENTIIQHDNDRILTKIYHWCIVMID